MIIAPLQLKIKNFYNELNTFANSTWVMLIYNDDKDFFRKCIKIWNKIIELIGINNPIDFVEADDHYELFIMADVHKNTSFVIEDNYRYGHNKVVIVLHSVINDCIKISLVQHRYILIITIFFNFFSLPHIRMNGKSINFDNNNIKKSDFYIKNKKKYLI